LIYLIDGQLIDVGFTAHAFEYIADGLGETAYGYKDRVQVLVAPHSETAYEHKHAADKNGSLYHVHALLTATEDQLSAEHVRFGVPFDLLVLILFKVFSNEVLPFLLLRVIVEGNYDFQDGLGETE
jgi:hypothetical protein